MEINIEDLEALEAIEVRAEEAAELDRAAVVE